MHSHKGHLTEAALSLHNPHSYSPIYHPVSQEVVVPVVFAALPVVRLNGDMVQIECCIC